jgi:salicylate hydroxylase
VDEPREGQEHHAELTMGGKPHVLVVGAGIGGLAAALALLRRGFDVDVYEQATELKEVGAGVQISPNGNRVLHELGVLDEVRKTAVETESKEIRLWNTGQTWKLFDLGTVSMERYAMPYLTVYRPDLHAALADGVRKRKPDALHLKAKCIGFESRGSRMAVRLQDGRTAEGDALIGADGVHSGIRTQLFGADKPRFTGIIAWRTIAPMARLPQHMNRMVASNWVGAGGHVVHYPLRRGELMNCNALIERNDWKIESWSTLGELDECLRDFTGWHEDVHQIFKNGSVLNKWALMLRDPMERWGEGRVTLVGDACHPMLPMLAQGAVMALEDGFILARCLEKYADDVPTALKRYEDARRDRANKTVVGSAENARRFHNPTLASREGAQAYVDREWSEERIKQRYEWLFTYDVTRVPI